MKKLAPIVKSIVVRLAPEAAFELFTTGIASWWPLDSHSVTGDVTSTVVFEPHRNGRIYEHATNGDRYDWGTVLEYLPPRTVRFTWYPGRPESDQQIVEVTFSPESTGTRVTLTHSGWEAFGDRAAEMRANYDGGWDLVLGSRYGESAGLVD